MLACGCSSLLPRSEETTHSAWQTYQEAQQAFDAIEPGKTTLAELKAMSLDPANNANISILNYADVLRRFLVSQAVTFNDLDAGVLDVLARTGSLFAKGGTCLSVGRVGHSTLVLDVKAAVQIRTLAEETPAPCVSRLRGQLDSLTVSTKAISLRLEDGRAVRGFAGAIEQEQLKALLGTEVVVEGWFNFRPSGEALRIEVESVKPAKPGDAVWAQLPKREPTAPRSRPSSPALELDALFGKWPGDESDDRLAEALRELQ